MRITLVLIALMLTSCIIKSVDIMPNQVGVIRSNGGLLQPGNHLIPFYEEFAIYEISEQSLTQEIQILTKDLKPASTEFLLRYFPQRSAIDSLDNMFGEKYVERMVIPELRAGVRRIFQGISADSLNKVDKKKIELLVREDLTTILRSNHVIVSEIELKQLKLP